LKENKLSYIGVALSLDTVGTKDWNCLQDVTVQSAADEVLGPDLHDVGS
jgi:hypothetical protein